MPINPDVRNKGRSRGPLHVGDLMMTTTPGIPRVSKLVAEFQSLAAYQARREARPAFQAAIAVQIAFDRCESAAA
jgi:glutathione S-transferase